MISYDRFLPVSFFLCRSSIASSLQGKSHLLNCTAEKIPSVHWQGSGFYPSSQPQLSNDVLENVQVHKLILELSALLNTRQLFLEGPLTGADFISTQQQS